LNKEQKELIGSIQGDTERLLRITGELLNLSQVETGKIELRFQPVKAIEVIRYATESLRVQAQYKNLAISITASESLPTIHADLEKTTWVLINLLSNAIRYSPENGTIEISVKEKGKHLEFTVQDSGKGIDPKYTDRVFDRFFRIPGSEQAGTGLGLAIAREFIRAQGGEIEVCNSKTSGACFMFRLPCQN
jgi:NtrC-family two-component system sensor histidine kinase KinB